MSKSLGLKLAASSSKLDADLVTIEFKLEMDYEWVSERPKAKFAITEAVQKNFGKGARVEFTVRNREASVEASSAVELPAEGSKLEELARQVFAADPGHQRNGKTPGEGEIDSEIPTGS